MPKRALLLFLAEVAAGLLLIATPQLAAAVTAPAADTNAATNATSTNSSSGPDPLANPDTCVKVAIPLLSGGANCIDNSQPGGAIVAYMKEALVLLSGAIGSVILLMLIIAGIQYITSLGTPARVAAAKKRIINAITALILFLMAFAILNFLLPGGLV
jgi:hypothetical protein